MENKFLKFIPGIVAIIIVVVLMAGNIIHMTSKQHDISKEFPKLTTKDSINSIVLTIHTFSGFRSVSRDVYITIKYGEKYRIQTDYNNNYHEQGIGDNLSLGDRIIKRANCDTVYIEKRDVNKILFFLLHKDNPE